MKKYRVVQHKDGWNGFLLWTDHDDDNKKYAIVIKEDQPRDSHSWEYALSNLTAIKSNADVVPMLSEGFEFHFLSMRHGKALIRTEKIESVHPCATTTMYVVSEHRGEFKADYERMYWEDEILSAVENAPAAFQILASLLGQNNSHIANLEASMKKMEGVFKEMEKRYNRFDYDIARIVEREVGEVKAWAEHKMGIEKRAMEELRIEMEEGRKRRAARMQQANEAEAHHEFLVSQGFRFVGTRSYMARRTELMEIGRARLGI